MKNKLFDLTKYILSVICFILLFGVSYEILSTTFKSEEIDEGDSFHNLPNNSMDVIVLGSSHAQYSFSPVFFYQDTGLYSYVLATPCQPLDVSYSMLKEALKTQSPKVVVLEVFTAMPLKRDCDDGVTCYIGSAYQMRDKEKYETLKKLPKEKFDTYINPYVSSHNNWRTDNYSAEDIRNKFDEACKKIFNKKNNDFEKISRLFGYIDNYPSFPVENSWYAYTTNVYEDVDLELRDMESLDNIYKLCRSNNIELVLYKTPIDSLDDENLSYLNKVWEWAENNNIKYIDFIKKSKELDYQMWIQSDSFHSYINGASIITNELAKEIVNYPFSHKKDDVLEALFMDASCGQTLSYLKSEYDPSKYLKRIINNKGPMLIVYKDSNKIAKEMDELFDKYGINSSMIAFIDNEQIIDKSDTCVGITYKDVNIYSDNNLLEIDGNVYEINCGLTIVVFSSDMKKHYKLDTNIDNMWKNGYFWYGE